MKLFHVNKPDDIIKKIILNTFPNYRGKKIKISTDIPKNLNSYWQGGSRDRYCFYQLSTGTSYDVTSNHPVFNKNNPRNLEKLPTGIVIVRHSIYCGEDMGIFIYANKEDISPLLPEKVKLTEDEKIVLKYTKSYKPSYNKIKNYRLYKANRETNISLERWNLVKETLIKRKLLNKAGAITVNGRNALEI